MGLPGIAGDMALMLLLCMVLALNAPALGTLAEQALS